MEISTKFKVAKPSQKHWAGVFGYRPEKNIQLKFQGEMLAVLSIRSEIETDLATIGGLLFDELQAKYFIDKPEPSEMQDFEKAVYAVRDRLDMILEREAELAKTGIDLELAVAVIKDKYLTLGVVGESKVFIARTDQVADITGALIDPNMDGFVRTGSLELSDEDRLLLTTADTGKFAEEEGAQEILNEFDIDTIEPKQGAMLLVGYNLDPKWLESKVVPVVEDDMPEAVESVPEGLPVPDVRIPELNPLPISPATSEGMNAELSGSSKMEMVDEDEELDGEYEYEEEGESFLDKAKTKALKYANDFKVKFAGVSKVAVSKAKERMDSMKNRSDISEAEFDTEFERSDPSESSTSAVLLNKSKVKAKALFDKAKTGVTGLIATARGNAPRAGVANPMDRRNMYLRGGREDQRKWKLLVLAAVLLAVVLIFGGRKLIQDNEQRQLESNINAELSKINNALLQLEPRAGNLTASETEKQSILSDLETQVIKEAEELLSVNKNYKTNEIQDKINKAEKLKDQVINARPFTEPPVIADIGVNFAGAEPTDLVLSNGQLYVSDKAKGVIYRLKTNLNSEAGVLASGLNAPYLLTRDATGNIIFADQNPDSAIGQVDIATSAVKRFPGLSTAKIGTLASMEVWWSQENANNALYSVNPTKQAVLKQENVAGNYQIPNDAAPWRNDAEFGAAVDIAVDGRIYVLIRGKGIQRYYTGLPDSIEFSGLVQSDLQALTQATAFDLTDTKLYVADSVNKRILIFSNPTETSPSFVFKEQIVYRGEGDTLGNVKEIVSNEAEKKLYVLDGSKVIRLDLT